MRKIQNIASLPPLSLSALVESLLFVSPAPLSVTQIAKVLDVPARTIEKEIELLENVYQERGICIQRFQGKVQLVSAPQAAPYIEVLLGLDSSYRLSNAALETLAIIVYKQPITRPQVESIRGVNSDGVIKSLLAKGLIEEVGRAETPGRPALYSITSDFLQHFGLKSLDELPNLEEAGELELELAAESKQTKTEKMIKEQG